MQINPSGLKGLYTKTNPLNMEGMFDAIKHDNTIPRIYDVFLIDQNFSITLHRHYKENAQNLIF